MLGWELPPFNSGGLGEACFGMSKALAEKGAEIIFVLPQKIDVKVDFMKVVFADVKELTGKVPEAYDRYSEWVKNIKDGHFTPFDFMAGAYFYSEKIRDIARKFKPDVIHAHDWFTYPAGIVAKKVTGKPLVVHAHATEIDRTGGQNPNMDIYNIEKEGFEFADRIVPVGKWTANIITERYGIDPSKMNVVYNGIEDTEKKRLSPILNEYKKLGFKIVLFLGRITLQKGPEYFVRAAKKVLDFDKKVLFVVTGSGDMYYQMVREATDWGIAHNMIFTGFLRGDDKDRVFQSADLYVMPSVSEPFGITALEAVANGTPVLVSNQSGVSEVIQHALKVDFWDVDEMANKIYAAIKYPPLTQNLLQESSKEVKNLSWSKAADSLMSVYASICL